MFKGFATQKQASLEGKVESGRTQLDLMDGLRKGAWPRRMQHHRVLFGGAGFKRWLRENRQKAFPWQAQLSLPRDLKVTL